MHAHLSLHHRTLLIGAVSAFVIAIAAGAAVLYWPQSATLAVELSNAPLHGRPDLKSFPAQLDDLALVAHYDDESLAEGGFLASEVRAGKKVGVVFVTYSQGTQDAQRIWYGRSSILHRARFRFRRHYRVPASAIGAYAAEREQESAHALTMMGIPQVNRLFLRYPDLRVNELYQQIDTPVLGTYADPNGGVVEQYRGSELESTLRAILDHAHPARIITHFPDDTNADHRAIGRMVAEIVRPMKHPPQLLTFLVHWNNHDAAWAPTQYAGEKSWVTVQPEDAFQAPTGSPQTSVSAKETNHIDWPDAFVAWKLKLLAFYTSQQMEDPSFFRLFAKRNELLWDLSKKKLLDLRYGTVPTMPKSGTL